MHDSVMKILPWSLALHCIFNIYAYSDQDIFPLKLLKIYNPNTQQYVYKSGTTSFWDSISSEMGAPFLAIIIFGAVIWLIELTFFEIVY